MAIIEIIGGPITHKYLMGKTKHDLADMYMRLLRETASEAKDAARYRWLLDTTVAGVVESAVVISDFGERSVEVRCGSDLDTAIDTAMHATGD